MEAVKKKSWHHPEDRKLSWKEVMDGLPWDLAEQVRGKLRKAELKRWRNRPALTGEAFVSLWNQAVRELKAREKQGGKA